MIGIRPKSDGTPPTVDELIAITWAWQVQMALFKEERSVMATVVMAVILPVVGLEPSRVLGWIAVHWLYFAPKRKRPVPIVEWRDEDDPPRKPPKRRRARERLAFRSVLPRPV